MKIWAQECERKHLDVLYEKNVPSTMRRKIVVSQSIYTQTTHNLIEWLEPHSTYNDNDNSGSSDNGSNNNSNNNNNKASTTSEMEKSEVKTNEMK